MPGSILGTSVRRVEDRELITGESTYVGNLRLAGLLHLAFVRSPIAHGRITGIDTAEAAAAPGVVAVFTAADLDLPAHHGLMVAQPGACRGRRWPPTGCASSARPSPSSWPRRRPPRSTPPSSWRSTTTRCPRWSTRRPRSRRARAAAVRGPRHNLAAGQRADPDDADRAGRRRGRRAGPDGQPAARGHADGGQRDRGAARRLRGPRRRAHHLGLHPDAARLPRPGGEAVRPRAGPGPGDHAARRRRLRRQGRDARRAHRGGRRGAARWAARSAGWRPARRTWSRCRTGAARSPTTSSGSPATAGSPACARGSSATPAPTRGSAARSRSARPTLMSQGVYDIPKLAFDGAVALTNTTPMGAFRGAGRPEAAAHLERHDGPGRRRAGHGSGRDPAAQLPRPRVLPGHHAARRPLRHRRLRPAAARGAAPGRLRQAARGAAPPPRGGRPDRAGHRDLRLRRDHRGRRRQRVRLGHRARRRLGHDLGGHLGARPGPRHRVRDAGERPARHPDGEDQLRAVRHRGGAARRRAPAGRGRCRWAATPCSSRPTTCWSRPGAAPRRCWRPPSRTSSSPTRASSASRACRR